MRAVQSPRFQRVELMWMAGLLVVTAWAVWPLLAADSTGAAGSGSEAAAGVRVDPGDVYNPVLAGEPLPDGFRQVLPRDAILPVYDPVFVAADESGWPGNAEVIGVEIDAEARAYPVSFLNGREMVIDEIAEVPIVVTW